MTFIDFFWGSIFIFLTIAIVQLIYNIACTITTKHNIKRIYGQSHLKTKDGVNEQLLIFWERELNRCIIDNSFMSHDEIYKIANKEWYRILHTLVYIVGKNWVKERIGLDCIPGKKYWILYTVAVLGRINDPYKLDSKACREFKAFYVRKIELIHRLGDIRLAFMND